jgi:hypothetical protein
VLDVALERGGAVVRAVLDHVTLRFGRGGRDRQRPAVGSTDVGVGGADRGAGADLLRGRAAAVVPGEAGYPPGPSTLPVP